MKYKMNVIRKKSMTLLQMQDSLKPLLYFGEHDRLHNRQHQLFVRQPSAVIKIEDPVIHSKEDNDVAWKPRIFSTFTLKELNDLEDEPL